MLRTVLYFVEFCLVFCFYLESLSQVSSPITLKCTFSQRESFVLNSKVIKAQSINFGSNFTFNAHGFYIERCRILFSSIFARHVSDSSSIISY